MPYAKIDGLGDIGINQDTPRFSLPPNALSGGQNVRAYHGRLRNFGGREFATTAPIEPYGLFAFETPEGEVLWIEGGTEQVYVFDGTNHTNISRTPPGGQPTPYIMNPYTGRWTGGYMNGLGFLCDGFDDAPQQWTELAITTPLVDMVYDRDTGDTWQDTGNRCYSMRPFSNTIVAMNLRRGLTRLPNNVQWCDFIVPGDTDTDWTPKATNRANEVPLGATTGAIIDGAPLRDDFIIYKTDAVYRMYATGIDSEPFGFERLPEYVRVINRNCIGVGDEFQVIASRDDVQVFAGNTFRSVLNRRYREAYQSLMNSNRILTVFVAMLAKEKEAWVCLPTSDSEFPTLALVWNYARDTISITDIPLVKDMDQGIIIPTSEDFFDSTTPVDLSFNSDILRFDEGAFQTSLDFMIGAHGTSISIFGEATTDNGTPRLCLAERIGLLIPDGEIGYSSAERASMVREVRPYIQATAPVEVQIGSQDSAGGPVTWQPSQIFDPTSSDSLNFRVTGNYFGWRVRSEADVLWEITSIEFRWEAWTHR